MEKRILVITAFVPSRIGAGENFTRQMLKDLSVSNNVDLIYFKYSYDSIYSNEGGNVNVVRVYKNNVFIKIFNCLLFPFLFPLFTVRFNLFRLIFIRNLIRKGNYTCVIFDFSQTFLFSRFIKHPNVILNCHDVIAQRYSRIYKGIFLPFVMISEKFVFDRGNHTIFNHSEKDSRLLDKYYKIKSKVTNLFVDTEVSGSVPGIPGNYYVFFANWKRKDNLTGLKWFAKKVLPYLHDDIEFKIIGSGLPDKLLISLPGAGRLVYMGFLDNPYQLISDARALISPLFTGAGIKVKVFESLVCGTPVIGTPISFEGIPEIYNNYLICASSDEEFIATLNRFTIDKSQKLEIKRVFASHDKTHAITDFINGLQ